MFAPALGNHRLQPRDRTEKGHEESQQSPAAHPAQAIPSRLASFDLHVDSDAPIHGKPDDSKDGAKDGAKTGDGAKKKDGSKKTTEEVEDEAYAKLVGKRDQDGG